MDVLSTILELCVPWMVGPTHGMTLSLVLLFVSVGITHSYTALRVSFTVLQLVFIRNVLNHLQSYDHHRNRRTISEFLCLFPFTLPPVWSVLKKWINEKRLNCARYRDWKPDDEICRKSPRVGWLKIAEREASRPFVKDIVSGLPALFWHRDIHRGYCLIFVMAIWFFVCSTNFLPYFSSESSN